MIERTYSIQQEVINILCHRKIIILMKNEGWPVHGHTSMSPFGRNAVWIHENFKFNLVFNLHCILILSGLHDKKVSLNVRKYSVVMFVVYLYN